MDLSCEPFAKVTEVRLKQFSNAYAPIDVTVEGITTLFNALQPENILAEMVAIPSVNVMFSMLMQYKYAFLPMLVNAAGKVRVFKLRQYSNALVPIVLTLDGKFMASRTPFLEKA